MFSVKFLSVHTLVYAVFVSRSAIAQTMKPCDEDGVPFGEAPMHISHDCHFDSCCNPHHLSVETPSNNLLRNACKSVRVCLPNLLTGRQCIFFDDVDQEALIDSVKNKRGTVKAANRLKESATIVAC
jgi:hypothetical protein